MPRWSPAIIAFVVAAGAALFAVAPALAATFGLITTVTIPSSASSSPATYGAGYLDPGTQRYYLPDRAAGALVVLDTVTRTYLTSVSGFTGNAGSASSGPNAVVPVPARNQLWVTDGDSTVKVIERHGRGHGQFQRRRDLLHAHLDLRHPAEWPHQRSLWHPRPIQPARHDGELFDLGLRHDHGLRGPVRARHSRADMLDRQCTEGTVTPMIVMHVEGPRSAV